MSQARNGNPNELMEFFDDVFVLERLNLTAGAATNYRVAIRHLYDFWKVPVLLEDLSDDLLLRFMRHLKSSGTQSERTINNKRAAIKTVWMLAFKKGLAKQPGVIGRYRVPKRIVQAWTVDEVGRILIACKSAPSIRGWNYRHWRGLVLTIYDTSHRIGALLKTPRSALNSRGELLVRAEVSKHFEDKLHVLHPETVMELSGMHQPPGNEMLFPWPLAKREIWRRFKPILKEAGLTATRRDLFHKLRRTSFTYVYAFLGEEAARDHAAHTSNVTSSYLDRELVRALRNLPSAIDVLPRPEPR